MSKKKRQYVVNLDMAYSYDFKVFATSKIDAEKLAIEKLKKKANRKMFNAYVKLND